MHKLPPPIEKFKAYFHRMDPHDPSLLDGIYDEHIVFQDPIHTIRGSAEVKRYFTSLNKNLQEGGFTFTDETISGGRAHLAWDMTIMLKGSGKVIRASGISVLAFGERITHHRDYFDAGELFYENIPLLGAVVRSIKGRLRKMR